MSLSFSFNFGNVPISAAFELGDADRDDLTLEAFRLWDERLDVVDCCLAIEASVFVLIDYFSLL